MLIKNLFGAYIKNSTNYNNDINALSSLRVIKSYKVYMKGLYKRLNNTFIQKLR